MQEEIKRMLKLWNACYTLLHNLLSCLLLSGGKKVKIQRNTILLAVLRRHVAWRFTFICEHMLRVFENRVLREIMEAKTEEIRGGWRKVYNEEHHNLQPSKI